MKVLLFILAMMFTVPAYALDQAAVEKFCADPDRKLPAAGKQPDGKPAEQAVLDLKAGTYKVGDDGSVEVFGDPANMFILSRPKNLPMFRGTEGDDMMSPTALGGCTLGQLSEALKRNNLTVSATDTVQ